VLCTALAVCSRARESREDPDYCRDGDEVHGEPRRADTLLVPWAVWSLAAEIRNDGSTPKVRFSATLGEEPEVELERSSDWALVPRWPNCLEGCSRRFPSLTAPTRTGKARCTNAAAPSNIHLYPPG
jgi:hypothetical protein